MASSFIDHAIDAAGFGRLQLTTLVAAGLTWSGDAMEMSVMAYVLPSLKAEWQVSQAAADSLASVIFAGMLIGALGWGIFSDAYGRRFGWLLTAALTAVAGLLSALAPSWQLFLLFRILVGIGLAGTNLGFALSSELLPRRARGTQLMLFELFFVGGSVSVVMLAWMLLPQLGWRTVLVLSTLPLWVSLALCGGVPESPRWLAGHGDERAAALVLERICRANGQPLPPSIEQAISTGSIGGRLTAMPSHADCGEGHCDGQPSQRARIDPGGGGGSGSGDGGGDGNLLRSAASPQSVTLCTLPAACCRLVRRLMLKGRLAARATLARVTTTVFHPQLRVASMGLCLAWALGWFVYFGVILLTPKVIAAAFVTHGNGASGGTGGSVYTSSLLATLAEIPGLLLATYGVNRIGRVGTCVGCMLIASFALLAVATGHVLGDRHRDRDREEYVSRFGDEDADSVAAVLSESVHSVAFAATSPSLSPLSTSPTTSSTAMSTSPTAMSAASAAQLLLIAVCRMAAFGGFSALYVLTAETFPTALRATGFGVVSACSRLAGTLTPFVAGSGWDASPEGALLAYAIAAASCAAVLRCCTAETRNRPMSHSELAPIVLIDPTGSGGDAVETRDRDRV